MGFDQTRFETNVKEEFICPICHDVLENPLSVPGCDHVYCSYCIKDWLQRNKLKVCPIDRRPTNPEQLQTPLRLFCNLLNELNIRCEYEQCQKYFKLSDIEKHRQQCLYNPENKEKEFDCPKNCGAIIKLSDRHDCIDYMKQLIQTLQSLLNKKGNDLENLRKELKEERNRSQNLSNQNKEMERKIFDLQKKIETLNDVIDFRQIDSKNPTSASVVGAINHNNKSNQSTPTSPTGILIELDDLPSSTSSSSSSSSSSISSCASISSPNNNIDNNKNKEHKPMIMANNNNNNSRNSTFYCEPEAQQTSSVVNLVNKYQEHQQVPQKESKVKRLVNRFGTPAINHQNLNQENMETQQQQQSSIVSSSSSSSSSSPMATMTTTTVTVTTMNSIVSNNNNNSQNYKYSVNERVEQALRQVNRKKFFESSTLSSSSAFLNSNENKVLTLVKKQSHSFPFRYEIKLLELIEPFIRPESHVLDIGSGQGFLTCCLAFMCQFVVGIEHLKELVDRSQEIVAKHFQQSKIYFCKQDGRNGCEQFSPYDLILIEPIVKNFIPDKLWSQLKSKGSLIAVIKSHENNNKLKMIRFNKQKEQVEILSDDHQWLEKCHKDYLSDLHSSSSQDTFRNLNFPIDRMPFRHKRNSNNNSNNNSGNNHAIKPYIIN